ncbi:MAG TPA: hypothetical protein DC042_14560 [Bacteroidales bacterium]|nr:hypothetical protein [Bacteroidales bacterium]
MSTFDFWGIIIVPLLIFLARIGDVSIGTVRIIFVSKGYRYLAPLLGFFEVFIWLMAMTKILENLDRWYYYLAYCGGFATGNFIGIIIEEKIAIGYTAVRVITKVPAEELIKQLTDAGYGVTFHTAQGSTGTVDVVYTIIKRSELPATVSLINKFNPDAFYTVEELKAVNRGIHPFASSSKISPFRRWRQGK